MMEYFNAFWVGGMFCLLAQILIDKTKLTPARILTGYVCLGVLLSAIGVFAPLKEYAGAGASVPLVGFGHILAEGSRRQWKRTGFWESLPGGWRRLPRGSQLRCCLRWFGAWFLSQSRSEGDDAGSDVGNFFRKRSSPHPSRNPL